jgi:7-cyano-7-deazaguanine reductase
MDSETAALPSPPPSLPVAGMEGAPLGQTTDAPQGYAPECLFPVARALQREGLGLEKGDWPFYGMDAWTAYELSWLDSKGKPQVALGRFEVPACSPRLIESKSLKLYLNGFNQTRISDSETLRRILVRDLSDAVGAPVKVDVRPLQDAGLQDRVFAVFPKAKLIDTLPIAVDDYTPLAARLQLDPARGPIRERLFSHLLRSNCLVTGQPDWASVCIDYSGMALDREGLLRYLIGFRLHKGFHEQCVERIFMDILSLGQIENLTVWARYTRRGGLDINPLRSTKPEIPPDFWLSDLRQ